MLTWSGRWTSGGIPGVLLFSVVPNLAEMIIFALIKTKPDSLTSQGLPGINTANVVLSFDLNKIWLIKDCKESEIRRFPEHIVPRKAQQIRYSLWQRHTESHAAVSYEPQSLTGGIHLAELFRGGFEKCDRPGTDGSIRVGLAT